MRNTQDDAGRKGGRIIEVDLARGCAVALMIFYHFMFDLDFLGIFNVGIGQGFWFFFPRGIGALFLLVAGISLTLSESRNKEGYVHHAKRGLLLAVAALAITAATWIYPHEGFIQFGIIHLMAFSAFIAPFFLRMGKANVLIGLLIIAAGVMMSGVQVDSHYLFWLGLTYPGYTALDHYPVFPWFGFVLIGIYAGATLYPGGMRRGAAPAAAGRISGILDQLGRNSLLIYLAHQPIIIGALVLLKSI